MQEVMIADIGIFNPDSITEASSMKKGMNGSFTKGFLYVLVSGKIIIDDGGANIDLRPGQPIRYPVTEEGESGLDIGDKVYSRRADIETLEDEHSEFPDRPAVLEESISGAPKR
ncbi:hypothetical protein [uncultured Shimia sp.]|uniref:hypothetical protein n=1 Tax=uncultured Shimia sp. TaxID=573152 RepID=UPI0026293178|nr:hypothetical protein [uncultured Shimia sp.]